MACDEMNGITLHESAGDLQNGARTCEAGDTGVAQPCFPDVRRDLIATRVIVGPKSRKGHACSNLVEQLEHMQTATGEQRANLQKAIPLQMAVLAGG